MSAVRGHGSITSATAAVQLEAGGPLVMTDVEVRAPGRREVKVSMRAAALCHTDLEALSGGVGDTAMPTPLVVGHEGAGVVTELGADVVGVRVGDHVVLSPTAHDGTCPLCQDGHPSLCMRTRELMADQPDDGPETTLDGAPVHRLGTIGTFTTQTVMSSECVVVIDPAMPWDVACLLGCGVSTGVGAVRNAADVGPGDHVVVIGCGGVGLNIIQAAQLAGAASVTAVDVSRDKLDMALTLGATAAIDASTDDVAASVAAASSDGLGAHYCFESTGRTAVMTQALSLIRPGGTVVLLGMAPSGEGLTVPDISEAILQEKRIIGSMMGSGISSRDYPVLVEEYLNGSLALDLLITSRRPLAEVNEAIADMRDGIGIRTVFTF